MNQNRIKEIINIFNKEDPTRYEKYKHLLEQKPKFEVGKWYKILDNWWAKFSCIHNSGKRWQYTEKIDWNGVHGYYIGSIDKISQIVLLDNLSEIQQYLPEGHPDKFPPAAVKDECEECNGTGQVMKAKLYPSGHTEVNETCSSCKGSGEAVVKEWSVGTYVVYTKMYKNYKVGTIQEIVKYVNDYFDTKEERTIGVNSLLGRNLKWFATKKEAEAFSKELLKPTKYIPQVGDWVIWTGCGKEAYQVWKVEDDIFWIWYRGEQKHYHNYSFEYVEDLRKVELGENIKFDDEHIKTSKEELLEEAKRKYPVGTKFISSYNNLAEGRVINNNFYWFGENDIVVNTSTGHSVYTNGRWAEIISVPEKSKNPLPPSECYEGNKIPLIKWSELRDKYFTEKNTQQSNKKGRFAPIKANFINVKQLKTN